MDANSLKSFAVVKEAIESRISIVALADHLNLDLKQVSNGRQSCSCPFHSDSTPSFNIYPATNRYRCFGCGRDGTVYNLAKEFLMFTQGDKQATFQDIKRFLSAIDPSIESLVWQPNREIKINPRKKKEFRMLADSKPAIKSLVVDSPEKRRRYIAGIMKGFDDETLFQFIAGAESSLTVQDEPNDLFASLLEVD